MDASTFSLVPAPSYSSFAFRETKTTIGRFFSLGITFIFYISLGENYSKTTIRTVFELFILSLSILRLDS